MTRSERSCEDVANVVETIDSGRRYRTRKRASREINVYKVDEEELVGTRSRTCAFFSRASVAVVGPLWPIGDVPVAWV